MKLFLTILFVLSWIVLATFFGWMYFGGWVSKRSLQGCEVVLTSIHNQLFNCEDSFMACIQTNEKLQERLKEKK